MLTGSKLGHFEILEPLGAGSGLTVELDLGHAGRRSER